MSDVNRSLAESREALDRLITAGMNSGSAWATPRAPGKWSPSQIVEHVARALEESAKTIKGEPSAFPALPSLVRPLLRGLFFNRVLKKNAFINGRTNKAMNPIAGPQTPDDGRARLVQAHEAFARFDHTIFGNISTADYARFQALHTRHHTREITGH